MALIPSIDLSGGRIVQLVQGERPAIESDDIDFWIERFARYPLVQLIDLDAARGLGSNNALVTRILGALPCRAGGGIRTIERARALVGAGARDLIIGSALFSGGRPDPAAARAFGDAVGRERTIAAVDSRWGRVVIRGWRENVDVATDDAIRALDPHVGGFLYTHVDTEGLMRGIDMAAVAAARAAATRPMAAAGGISTMDEVRRLDAMGVDAVVGMALYTGRLQPLAP
ncbi:MAG: HisA/HisF-related TIM barrel protein [Vicinamibacterales bacterium]